jgi:hypothetical protein
MKLQVVPILLASTVLVSAAEMGIGLEAVEWELQLLKYGHSVTGRLMPGNVGFGGRNEISIYSDCDKRTIHFDELEHPPVSKTENYAATLRVGEGSFPLKYVGMQMGIYVFKLTDQEWGKLKQSKWAKLEYRTDDKVPVTISFDMTYLPLLIDTIDRACN